MKKFFIFVLAILFFSSVVLAGNYIALQGTVKQSGVSLSSGDLEIFIFDSSTGGNLIYNSTNDFDNAIANGTYDVMLGSGSNILNLNYGERYYLEMFVNGENFTFDGNPRQVFESAVGNVTYLHLDSNIPANYINKTSGTNWIGLNVESILDTIYGWIGAVNTTANIRGLGFNTTTELREVFVNKTDEPNLNVNSSNYTNWWGGISGWVAGWFVNSGNSLMFNDTKLNSTIDARENDTLGAVGACSNEQVVKWNTTSSAWECSDVSAPGVGDIDEVNTPDNYLTGGQTSGSVNLYINETYLNRTITNLGLNNGFNSTYNSSYNAIINNISYLTTYNSTYDSKVSANSSFNQTLTDSLYIAQSEEPNLNVNSSNYTNWWGGISGWVAGWFVNSGNSLMFNDTKLNSTIDARENDTLGAVGACSNEQVVKWNTTSSAWECSDVSAPGVGDIDEVNTPDNYLTGGQTSGSVNLYINETYLNRTITNLGLNNGFNSTYNSSYNAIINNISYLTTYNSTYDSKVSANSSFNQTLTDSLYIAQSEEPNLNVNSSTWWGSVSWWATNWFVKSGNNLTINETKLNESIYAKETLNMLSCSNEQVVKWNTTSSAWYCSDVSAPGVGDIDEVNTPDNYLTGGQTSGSVNLYVNETYLNASIDTIASRYNNTAFAEETYAKLVGGNQINGTQDFDGGWTQGGASIVGGKGFFQTVYVYNISSLAVNQLSINGSLLPSTGFDNTFDLGSSSLRWRDLYLGGEVYSNGTGNNYFAGNVGIGTSSPTYKLQVQGNANISNGLNVSGGMNVLSGNVGIGTSSPGVKLDIYSVGNTRILNLTTDQAGTYVDLKDINGTGELGLYQGNIFIQSLGDKDIQFWDNEGITPKMVMKDGGNVGIGTTTPNYLLQTASGTANAVNLSNVLYINGTSGNVGIGTTTPNYLLQTASGTANAVNLSNVLYINGTSGNVGIGTSSPTYKLHVQGNANISNGLNVSGGMNVLSGNVGIGTANPSYKLHIDTTGGGVLINTTAGQTHLKFTDATNNKNAYVNYNNEVISFFDNAPAEKVTFNLSSGNVGIGTSSPAGKLEVVGDNVFITSQPDVGDTSGLVIGPSAVSVGDRVTIGYHNLGYLNIAPRTGYDTVFSRGNVGIGTSSPASNLEIQSSTTTGLNIDRAGSSTVGLNISNGNGQILFQQRFDSNSLYISNNNGEVMRIDYSGNVGIGTTKPNYLLETASGTSGRAVNLSNVLYINGTSGNVGIGTTTPNYLLETASGTGGRAVNLSGVLYVNSTSGNVGIGTSSPQKKLHVTNDSRIDGILELNPVQIAKVLEASDAADSDDFGSSVSLSDDGSVLAVGAYLWESTGTNRGGVYIYDWSGGTWVQRGSVIEASDAADGDRFGSSVSLSDDGSVLAVGAYFWESTGTDRGGVYIYDWSGGTWVQRGSVIEASDAADSDRFGSSVSLSDDGSVLAVGAYFWESTGTNRGGVYIYDWSGGTWVQRGSVIEASDAADSDYFGISVSLSDDGSVLAVGASLWESTGTNRGGVYIYDWSGGTWVQRGSVIEASDAADSDDFGSSVSLSDDGSVLAVGAYFWESTGTDRGGVYSYSLVANKFPFSKENTGIGWSVVNGNLTVISGNVGIGTTTPTYKLQVQGNANISNGLNVSGGMNVLSGNVGIGTSSPQSLLHISGTSADNPIARVDDISNDVPDLATYTDTVNADIGLRILNKNASATYSGISLQTREISQSAWNILNKWTGATAGDLLFVGRSDATTMTEKMRITSAGNVGIGTSSPTYKLQVQGNANVSNGLNVSGGMNVLSGNVGIGTSSPGNLLTIQSSTVDELAQFYSVDDNSFIKFNDDSDLVYFGIYSTYGFLDIDGGAAEIVFTENQVGIGTTKPTQRLEVAGNLNVTGSIWKNGGTPIDYVFDDYFGNKTNLEYKGLMTLDALHKYVEEHHHLPNYEPEKYTGNVEVGIMSEMNLEKIEELTLYILELKKENEDLKRRLDLLEGRNGELKQVICQELGRMC